MPKRTFSACSVTGMTGPVTPVTQDVTMRISDDADDAIIRGLENALKQFAEDLKQVAEDKGFTFASIFYEYHSGSRDAFDKLAETLTRTNARHVVVPSVGHLSGSAIIGSQLLMRLERGWRCGRSSPWLIRTPG